MKTVKRFAALAFALVIAACTVLPVSAAGDGTGNGTRDEIKVRRIYMMADKVTVRVNQERTLWVEVYPYDADDQTIMWDSSNPEIVTVDGDGLIYGISPGTATITATSMSGKTATCEVTVPGRALTGIEEDIANDSRIDSDIDGGATLSASKLRNDVSNTVKDVAQGATATLTYRDKTSVTTAALRSAAYSAEYRNRLISLKFTTWNDDGKSIQGQIILNPHQAPESDFTVNPAVYAATGDTLQQVRSAFPDAVGARLGQQGSYGMTVQVAVKMNGGTLSTSPNLYRYDSASGVWQPFTTEYIRTDDSGYVHFTATTGGTYAIV